MANPSTAKIIMNNWIEKSESEIHNFNKYIALWIAFNAYYSSATNSHYDSASLKILKEKEELKAWYLGIANGDDISNLLPILPITNMKSETDVKINSREDFASILETLYQIRNNLFHGSKSDHVERDEEVVKLALPILRQLVLYCQEHFDEIEF